MASNYPADPFQQKHSKTSVLRSFLPHKRTPSSGAALPSQGDVFITTPQYKSGCEPIPLLPFDHPHSRALGELHQNQQSQDPSLPKKSKEGKRPTTSDEGKIYLHKKTLSTISLMSLAGKDGLKSSKSKDKEPKSPKKTKSSTNLGKLLSRPKSMKSLRKQAAEDEAREQKDKENRNPHTSSSPTETESRPPIFAQFSSERFARQPLGGKFLEEHIDLYTPPDYIPGKQRDFRTELGAQPSLTRRDERKQRPKSTYLPNSFSIQDISRRVSGGSAIVSAELQRRVSGGKRPSLEKKTRNDSKDTDEALQTKRARAFAAGAPPVTKVRGVDVKGEPTLKDKDVDRELEAMLDRRNIPEHQRGKMRNLAMSVKKDFIKQDWAEIEAAKNGRPGTRGSDSSADVTEKSQEEPTTKSKRPRSRAFTLSRSSSKEPASPTKKQKADSSLLRHSRSKSTESLKEGNKSLKESSAHVAQTLIAKAKGQHPDDFVSYLRKVQKPQLVEVGRLHKLRLLLRNETVAWTDEFVQKGGMTEIVGLLHRIMAVEWREEHEDTLLHETLLCLKALSTTALALKKLNEIQVTLFPALLQMVFDEEKKGPSEFTTRSIITSLLFTYLKTAPLSERAPRAKILLSYLRDPEPSESNRPVGFVLEMRQPRPYRVWGKEVVNVTKEVFWIFLHHLNVIALPGARRHREDYPSNHDTNSSTISSTTSTISGYDASYPYHVYMVKHFPKELPPVAAAPYVGGVEWDATTYLASHLDIVNGILASLPTKEERNQLREQLRVSGWEKCMGNTLRTCKEKFYGGVHAGLRCWVAAAQEDGWNTGDVRCGAPTDHGRTSPRKSAKKGPVEVAPKLDLNFGHEKKAAKDDGGWL